MNQKFIFILAILIVAGLSACGNSSAPTMSADDVKASAVANAWAAVTLTQAAMPTSTSAPTAIPPTHTPFPSVVPFPTIPPLQSTVPAGNPTADPCNDVPPTKPKGATVQIELVNKSDGRVSPLSFGMVAPNSLGECGTYTFYLGNHETSTQTVLAGCYWGYGYIDTPSVAKTAEYLCVTDAANVAAIWISNEVIGFH